MDRLKIKNEYLPERCEICHQTDQFNSSTGYCARCNNVPMTNYQQYGYNDNNFIYGKPQGIWRDYSTLILHKQAELPRRCVKCNTPVQNNSLVKKLSWFHSGYYLLLLVNMLVFLLVTSLVRKTAIVNIGLCEHHKEMRTNRLIASWAAGIIGVLICILGIGFLESVGAFFLGLLLFFAGIIFGSVTSRVVKVKKIDDNYVWLDGVNSDYVAELPPLPR